MLTYKVMSMSGVLDRCGGRLLPGLLLVVGFAVGAQCSERYPPFSWDRVPVCLHFGSPTRMTDEQIQRAARMSNLICLEKAHGRQTDPVHPERVAGEDARRLKRANPNARVLMYWNTLIAWPFTSYNRRFAETHPYDWILRDRKTGEPLLKVRRGNFKVFQYNLLKPEVRQWWAETIGNAVKELGFDGIFMDAVLQAKRPVWLRRGWGLDKADELDAAVIDMMRRVRAIMGPDRLIIYNGFRTRRTADGKVSADGAQFLPYADGAMIEHFDGLSSTTKEETLRYWQMAAEAARAGKIVVYKCWPDHNINWLNKEFMSKPDAEKEAIARRRIGYALACYLIGAQENSYFCYGWGYNIADGQLIDYPEYRHRLGPPKGDAIREPGTWIFRREFEHARVVVDLEKREGGIEWLED